MASQENPSGNLALTAYAAALNSSEDTNRENINDGDIAESNGTGSRVRMRILRI